MRRRWSSLFFVVGLVAVALACRAALGRTGGAALPGAPALAAAAAVLAGGLLAATRAWIVLLAGAAPGRELAHGFMLSQLGKYIPGGVWLGVGQVGTAVGAGVSAGRAAGSMAALGLCFVVAAATLGGLAAALALLAGGPGPGGHAALALAGLAGPALLHRRWMAAVSGRIARRLGRERGAAVIPDQRRILAACAWSAVSVAASALAFAVLLAGVAPGTGLLPATAAFCLAWLSGYLVLGLPSGIGAREAVLVALLPAGAGPILAASLAQRVLQMAVEVVLAGSARILVARAARRTRSLPLEAPHA